MAIMIDTIARQFAVQIPTTAPMVIKVGGSIFDRVHETIDVIADAWQRGIPVVVVHGGGPLINEWLRKLNVTPQFINGRRVTDAATLEIVRAVLIGNINSEIVRQLVTHDCTAVGISGMDMQLIRTRRAESAMGLVGYVEEIQIKPLTRLMSAGFLPVISPLCLGPDGECLNVNADDVATAIACALHASRLIFMSDVPGVKGSDGSIIPLLTPDKVQLLIADGIITGGMVPKVQSCIQAIDDITSIHIIDGSQPTLLARAMYITGEEAGTRFVR